MRLSDRGENPGEADIMFKAQHVAELHQKQQHRGHILKTGQSPDGRKLISVPRMQQPEQCLEQTRRPE